MQTIVCGMPFVPMRRRILGPSALFAAVVVLATACGTHSSSVSAANPSALRIAFSDDMGAPDPDSFYGTEGLMVTDSVYDGLLQYATELNQVRSRSGQPADGQRGWARLTFQLHAGGEVPRRHGGRLGRRNKASFARRTALKQGPAYMLAGVSSSTPRARYVWSCI